MKLSERRERLRGLSINRMIPNILTLLALCAGLTAIRFSLQERWEPAVIALVIAAILDTLDGRIARMLKGTSKFGAELDSLSDFLCFGVAPALLLYMWTIQEAGRFGWVLVLLYSVCCALRLARFNTNLEAPEPPGWTNKFFTGVPAPAGAGLVLLPVILSFPLGDGWVRSPYVAGPVIVVVSALLVSRIRTFAFKNFRVPVNWVLPTMLAVGLLAALTVSAPWLTLLAIVSAYAVSLPFGHLQFKKMSAAGDAPPVDDGDDELADPDDDGEDGEDGGAVGSPRAAR
jgi:CDP-diacylglycerol--serine O-phosphatidyltransferase